MIQENRQNYSDCNDPETYGTVPDSALSKIEKPAVTEESSAYIGDYPESENRKAIGTFLSKDWQPVSEHPRYGLMPLFFGTLKVTLIAILFRGPHFNTGCLVHGHFRPQKNKGIYQAGC